MRSQATYEVFFNAPLPCLLLFKVPGKISIIDIFPGTLTVYVKLSESLFNSAISCL